MMRILLVPDKKDWSYFAIAQALVKHNTDPDLHLEVMALKGNEPEFWTRQSAYGRVLVMGHQMMRLPGGFPQNWFPGHRPSIYKRNFEKDRFLTGIHSHHAFDIYLRTTPDYDYPPPKWLLRFLQDRFRAVNCVSQRLFDLFSGQGLNLHLTQNGVDTEVFKPTAPLSTDGPLRVGFAGTAKGIHDARKGYSEYVVPACCKAGCKLITAIARTETCLPPEQMPEFWNSVDVMLLPSSSEGFSIAALEAAACGRPVISTRVGGSTELIRDGQSGFLVDRTVNAIAEKLVYLQGDRDGLTIMGAMARDVVVSAWSWAKRAPAWLAFLKV